MKGIAVNITLRIMTAAGLALLLGAISASAADDAATLKRYWKDHCEAKNGTLFELNDRSYACDRQGLENDVLCEIGEDGATACQWAVMVSVIEKSYGNGKEVLRGVIKPDGGVALLPALLNVEPGTLEDCILEGGEGEDVDGTVTCCYKDKAMCVNCIDNKCFCLGDDCPKLSRLTRPLLPTDRVLLPVDR